MISSALAEYLEQERDRCNHLFSSVRHQYPHIEVEAFSRFLTDYLDPIVCLIDGPTQQTIRFAEAAYEHGLELAAKQWLGEDRISQSIQQLWLELIPQCLSVVVLDPKR